MMKRTFYSLFAIILLCQACVSQNTVYASTDMFQLSDPRINVSAIFFESHTTVTINVDLANSVVKYAIDGSPVNQNSKVYTTPLKMTESVVVKAKVFHPDYLESEEVQIEVVKIANKRVIKEMVLSTKPNDRYPGLGSEGLMDFTKGSAQFGGDKQWMGFQTDTISAELKLDENVEISQVIISALTNQSNWIFAPGKIEVFNDGKIVGTTTYPKSDKETSNSATFLSVPLVKGNYDKLKVVVYPLKSIPEWHQGKGTTPWVFIDEIIIQ
tara:strand:- start:385 stop:1191 length:807 start_codon:yes stop_codon:yes gene_type:complete